jgi:hypothetical protein
MKKGECCFDQMPDFPFIYDLGCVCGFCLWFVLLDMNISGIVFCSSAGGHQDDKPSLGGTVPSIQQ